MGRISRTFGFLWRGLDGLRRVLHLVLLVVFPVLVLGLPNWLGR